MVDEQLAESLPGEILAALADSNVKRTRVVLRALADAQERFRLHENDFFRSEKVLLELAATCGSDATTVAFRLLDSHPRGKEIAFDNPDVLARAAIKQNDASRLFQLLDVDVESITKSIIRPDSQDGQPTAASIEDFSEVIASQVKQRQKHALMSALSFQRPEIVSALAKRFAFTQDDYHLAAVLLAPRRLQRAHYQFSDSELKSMIPDARRPEMFQSSLKSEVLRGALQLIASPVQQSINLILLPSVAAVLGDLDRAVELLEGARRMGTAGCFAFSRHAALQAGVDYARHEVVAALLQNHPIEWEGYLDGSRSLAEELLLRAAVVCGDVKMTQILVDAGFAKAISIARVDGYREVATQIEDGTSTLDCASILRLRGFPGRIRAALAIIDGQ